MKVTNNASYALIAFGFHVLRGYGEDVKISPGQTADVNGPYVGEMGGGSCHVALVGEIVCHEAPDNAEGFQVAPGNPLSLADGDRGITVRYCDDAPEEHVTLWRARDPAPVPSL